LSSNDMFLYYNDILTLLKKNHRPFRSANKSFDISLEMKKYKMTILIERVDKIFLCYNDIITSLAI